MRVLFSYIAQPHQTLHSLPIAIEMALGYPDVEVWVACLTKSHLEYIKSLARYYPTANLHYTLLSLPSFLQRRISFSGQDVFTKITALFLNRGFFNEFDGIVVPERTSLYLKKFGVNKPKMIWTRHGAGDRAIGFAKDVKNFDFILMAGPKLQKRLSENKSLRSGHFVTGIYAKFDIVRKIENSHKALFNNGRRTIIYNPHYKNSLSSWEKFGIDILQQFVAQNKYNLIFAPHFRLFDPPTKKDLRFFSQFSEHEHIHIDLGSYRSIDMTYTQAADLYMGDVSSQVAEFLVRPRPCLFLNAHSITWEKDQNYSFWHLGNVCESEKNIITQIETSFNMHSQYIKRQKDYIVETFGTNDGPTAPLGAKAIVQFLKGVC